MLLAISFPLFPQDPPRRPVIETPSSSRNGSQSASCAWKCSTCCSPNGGWRATGFLHLGLQEGGAYSKVKEQSDFCQQPGPRGACSSLSFPWGLLGPTGASCRPVESPVLSQRGGEAPLAQYHLADSKFQNVSGNAP